MIHDKDSVVGLLERLERVCREVKGLPDFVKRGMALNVGCLVTDLDELEGLIEQARTYVEDDLYEYSDNLWDLDTDTQIEVIKEALESDENMLADAESWNEMLADERPELIMVNKKSLEKVADLLTTLLEN